MAAARTVVRSLAIKRYTQLVTSAIWQCSLQQVSAHTAVVAAIKRSIHRSRMGAAGVGTVHGVHLKTRLVMTGTGWLRTVPGDEAGHS